MTPRGTDWSLVALVALLAATGGLTAPAVALGAAASTVWSSFTPEGRGAA